MMTATHFLRIGCLLGCLLAACCAFGQHGEGEAAGGEEPETITIDVTARRWEEPLRDAPVSVTVLTRDTLDAAGITTISDAAPLAPNLTLPEFSARWLSFPFVRGIGSGRTGPAVVTLLDGVPQLSFATANQEWLEVERVEILRGPQGALYGRNALGGVVNVVPRLPGDDPEAHATATAGNFARREVRGGAGGPLGAARVSASLGHAARDGYTMNELTGNALDDRDALFARLQVAWPEEGAWALRVSATAERNRDGGYALGDLDALRARPHRVAYDYEGFSERDLAQPVFTAVRRGASTEFTTITAYQWWEVRERTDIDLSPADLLRRATDESQRAWIQEFRLLSLPDAPASRERPALRWLLGLFAFTATHDQRIATEYRPDAMPALGVPLPFTQVEEARRRHAGVSPYGQATLALDPRAELTVGLRYDYEERKARIAGSTDPLLMPPTALEASRDFHRASPHASLVYQVTPRVRWYGTIAHGYKTGGFNTQAPPDATAFDEETSRSVETGVKGAWLDNRLSAGLALFRTTWEDMQLDVPTGMPGVFYIGNAGAAVSRGGEVEVSYRASRALEFVGGVGMLDTAFRAGSRAAGEEIAGNALPFAPRASWHAGARYARALSAGARGVARVDLHHTGEYYYDAANRAAEESHTRLDVRLGVARGAWRAEGWARNLTNAATVPVAFPFPMATSGYAGESGAPRAVGVTLGYQFR